MPTSGWLWSAGERCPRQGVVRSATSGREEQEPHGHKGEVAHAVRRRASSRARSASPSSSESE
eukprot:7002294-Alexandrium_andersonii.AAC.1